MSYTERENKEAEETAYWLELLAESAILPSAKLEDLHEENEPYEIDISNEQS